MDFLQDLSYMDLKDFSDTYTSNRIYSRLYSKLLHVINKRAPMKKLANREAKWKIKSWVNKKSSERYSTKKQNLQKCFKTKDIFRHNHYEHLRARAKVMINKSIKSYSRNYFQENIKNSKETWTNTNEVLNNRRKKHDHLHLSENEIIITTGKMFPNEFNNYVATVAETLVNELGLTNSKY